MNYDIVDVLKERHSCRSFADKPISDELVKNMVWAANTAPYASGGPRYTIYYTSEKAEKQSLMDACMGQKYVSEASVAFLFCSDDDNSRLRQGDLKSMFDISAACMCMDLYAQSLGYGTCWIGNFVPEQVKTLLKINSRPVIILLVGVKK